MARLFEILLRLYPAEYRAEFGAEMRAVFLALTASRRGAGFVCAETLGFIHGALYEHARRLGQLAPSLAGGAVFASGLHVLMYSLLVPVRDRGLIRMLKQIASHMFAIFVLAGIAVDLLERFHRVTSCANHG